MKRTDREAGILEYALEVLKNTTGIDYVIDTNYAHARNQLPDALIRLRKNGTEYPYAAEIKTRITNPILGAVIDRVRRLRQKGIIITDYVNPNIANKLKDMDIPFIDTAGNAYIREPGIYIFIKGNKPRTIIHNEHPDQIIHPGMIKIAPRFFPPAISVEPRNQAFQPAGLKVVFAFLCDPKIVNATFREIAKKAGVALGTVGWVMRNLKELRLLVETKKHKGRRLRKLVDKKALLNKWVEAYNERLRPTLKIGLYTTAQIYWWNNTDIKNYGGCWGGEVAAAMITEYLKPEVGTIYVKEMPVQLLRDFKMRQDPRGNVEILRQFWDEKFNHDAKGTLNTYTEIAPPIIIYADLLATGNARNLEAAKILYDKEILGLIGED